MPRNQRSCHIQNLSAEIPHENFVGAILNGQKGGFYEVQSLKLQRDYLDIWSVKDLKGRSPAQLEAKAFLFPCPVRMSDADAKKMRRIVSKRTLVDRIDLPSSGKRMLVSAIERSRAEWDNLVHATTVPARRGSFSSMVCDEEYPPISTSSALSATSASRCSSRATTRQSMYSDSDVLSEADTEITYPRPPSSCAESYPFHGGRNRTYAETLAYGLQTVKRKAASAGKGIRQNRRRRRKREERRQQKA